MVLLNKARRAQSHTDVVASLQGQGGVLPLKGKSETPWLPNFHSPAALTHSSLHRPCPASSATLAER